MTRTNTQAKMWERLENEGTGRIKARGAAKQAKALKKERKAQLAKLGLKVVYTGVLKRPRLIVAVRNVRKALGKGLK